MAPPDLVLYPLSSSRGHARYAPSGAKIWGNCAAAVPLMDGLEDTSGAAARRGTVMHAHAEHFLINGGDPAADTSEIGAEEDPSIRLQPAEWHPHVVPYVSLVRTIRDEAEFDAEPAVLDAISKGEVVFMIEALSEIYGEHCWGSVDAVVYNGRDLHVIDLKTGGRYVHVEENPQLALYAFGIAMHLESLKIEGTRKALMFDAIHLHIFQAMRSDDPHQVWTTSFDEVRQIARAHQKMIEASLRPDPEATPGEWCKDCKAGKAGRCAARNRQAAAIFADEPETPETALSVIAPERVLTTQQLTPEIIARVLDAAPAIEAIIGECRNRALQMHLRGDKDAPSGYKVIEGQSRRRWRKDMTEEQIAAALIEESMLDPYQRKITTITDAEGWCGKGKIDHLVEKPPGSPKLVPASAKGKPMLATREIFADLDDDDPDW